MKSFIQRIAVVVSFLCALFILSCKQQQSEKNTFTNDARPLHEASRVLLEAVMEDVFPPIIAARVYAYPHLAAYELLAASFPQEYQTLGDQLNGLQGPPPPPEKNYDARIAAVTAFCETAKKLAFSGYLIEEWQQKFIAAEQQKAVSEEVLNTSVRYGSEVSQRILAWAAKDNYLESRSFPRYVISKTAGAWKPTAPDYTDALEPHWHSLRPMALAAASDVVVEDAFPYSTDKNSDFYRQSMEVYQYSTQLDTTHRDIARYWDDNPSISTNKGHLSVFEHRISPAGHWFNIAAQVAKNKKAGLLESAEVYARLSIGLFDAFLSCWYEKYRTNVVRPRTYINELIDSDWKPYIQTPPFPEHPSGHSVISGTAAATLSRMYGKSTAFTDSTEVLFGFAPRSFSSFFAAADEAAMSRLYGGIHYRLAIEAGIKQGVELESIVAKKIVTKKAGYGEIK
ncbi:MAG: vanadium-dependent haloperoxidase [Sphingobacteriales bacterium]|nr:vanadium-dependent haloperoxidase [Sphingobacteriales bacterium]